MIEIITFTSTFTNAGEYRVSTVFFGDIIDELHERDGLANAGAAKQTNFAALGDRHDEVNDLDARLEQFGRCRLLFVARRAAMNRHKGFGTDVACIVDRLAEDIHDTTQRLLTNRHHDRAARVRDVHATLQAFRRTHRNGTDDAVAQLLLNFKCDLGIIDDQCIINFGNLAGRELNIHDGANNLHSCSSAHLLSLT